MEPDADALEPLVMKCNDGTSSAVEQVMSSGANKKADTTLFEFSGNMKRFLPPAVPFTVTFHPEAYLSPTVQSVSYEVSTSGKVQRLDVPLDEDEEETGTVSAHNPLVISSAVLPVDGDIPNKLTSTDNPPSLSTSLSDSNARPIAPSEAIEPFLPVVKKTAIKGRKPRGNQAEKVKSTKLKAASVESTTAKATSSKPSKTKISSVKEGKKRARDPIEDDIEEQSRPVQRSRSAIESVPPRRSSRIANSKASAPVISATHGDSEV